MLAKAYNTNSSSNTLNKELVLVSDIEIKFKKEVNRYNPTIMLKYDDIIDFNYMYIPKLNRYYFVEDIEIYPNKIFTLTLKCDVLMSFKDDILNSEGNITSQTNYNDYYNFDYASEVRKETNIYNSNVMLDDTKTMILCTIGGVQ